MIPSPKSLTAVVHVTFHYDESKAKAPRESEVEILSKLMDRASELDPNFQEILIKFADFIGKGNSPDRGQSPV